MTTKNPTFAGADTVFVLRDDKLFRTHNFGENDTNGDSIAAWESVADINQLDGTVLNDFEIDPFSPAQQGTGSAIWGYILTDTSLYYSSDMHSASPTFSMVKSVSNFSIIRCPKGIDGGAVLYGNTGLSGNIETNFDFFYDWDDYTSGEITYHPTSSGEVGSTQPSGNPGNAAQAINYSGTSGMTTSLEFTIDNLDVLFTNSPDNMFYFDYYVEPDAREKTYGDHFSVRLEVFIYDTSGGVITSHGGGGMHVNSGQGWHSRHLGSLDSAAPPGTRIGKIRMNFGDDSAHNPILKSPYVKDFRIDNIRIGTDPTIVIGDPKSKVQAFSSRGSVSEFTHTFGEGTLECDGMDCDDFSTSFDDLMIRAAGQDGKVYEINGINSIPIALDASPSGSISSIHIPRRRLSLDSLDEISNNQQESGLNAFITLDGGSAPVENTQDDFISLMAFDDPVDSGTYEAAGPYALALPHQNPRIQLFAAKDVSDQYQIFKIEVAEDGTPDFIPTTTTALDTIVFEPYHSERVYGSGPDGVAFSEDGGETFALKNGTGSGELLTGSGEVYKKVIPVFEQPSDCNSTSGASCPIGHASGSCRVGGMVDLQDGTVRLQYQDVQVSSPAIGKLVLVRHYDQNLIAQQLADASTWGHNLGWGWTHSHFMKILPGAGSAQVLLPNGAIMNFSEESTVGNLTTFVAEAGSASILEFDSSTQTYTLTAEDYRQYIFTTPTGAATPVITAITLPNGETLTYSYSNGVLDVVSDDYGKTLTFAYDASQRLQSVTDNAGRSTTFNYNTDGLLDEVTDAQSNKWTYEYYGNTDDDKEYWLKKVLSPAVDGTPITTDHFIYMTDGNGTITNLEHQRGDDAFQSVMNFQDGGNNVTRSTVDGFDTTHQFGGSLYKGSDSPLGNGNRQVINKHYRPVLQTDANGNETYLEWSNDGHFLERVTDANGAVTQFTYNADGTLNASIDNEGRTTTYIYGDSNNPRQPTEIKVLDVDGVTVLQHQQFTYDLKGRVLTDQQLDPSDGTTVQRETEYVYYTSGDGNGRLQTVTQKDLDTLANNTSTTYHYDAVGRVVKTVQSAAFGACTASYTVYDEKDQVVASICNYNPDISTSFSAANPPQNAAEAVQLREETQGTNPDANRVTTNEYDALGRRTKTTANAGDTLHERQAVTVYDSLGRVVRTISNFDATLAPTNYKTASCTVFSHGSAGTKNRISDIVYNGRGLVEKQTDTLDNTTLFGYDSDGRQIKVVRNASQPDYSVSSDPELSSYVPNALADQDIVTETAYDANGNVVKTVDASGQVTFMVYDGLNRVVKTLRNASRPTYNIAADPTLLNYIISDNVDEDHVTESEYDSNGRLVRAWDVSGNVTLYGYDQLDRQVKVIRNASQPDYDLITDPALSSYIPGDAVDHDIISETTYDASGRVASSFDVNDFESRYVYDGLGRQVLTVQNFSGGTPDTWEWDDADTRWEDGSNVAINHGDDDANIISQTHYDSEGRVAWTRDVLGRVTYNIYDTSAVGRRIGTIRNYVEQGSTDPIDWLWSTDNSQWEDGSGNAIDHGTNNDENILARTFYDVHGRAYRQMDHRGNSTLIGFDDDGRQVRVIRNASTPDYDVAADPALSAYPISSNPDADLVSQTIYDAVTGSVQRTIDAVGNVTWFVYDQLGRRVKTIANCTYFTGWPAPEDADYIGSDDTDKDIITDTIYDKAGRVVQSIDAYGTVTTFSYDNAGRRVEVTQAANTAQPVSHYTCFDKAGRTLRAIRNHVPEENRTVQYGKEIGGSGRYTKYTTTYSDPDARNADGTWAFAPTTHGSNNDENLITSYELDALGRVVATTDPVGNTTTTTFARDGRVLLRTDAMGVSSAHRYDSLRRLTRVVQNFVENGVDPANWVWSVANSQWEDGSSTAIDHGPNNDQNIIVDVDLDLVGRRESLTDPRGNITTYAYDQLNWRISLTNPLSYTWQTAYVDDFGTGGTKVTMTNPLTDTTEQVFDRAGRLTAINYLNESPKLTPDVQFSYDKRGNRLSMDESVDAFSTSERVTSYTYDKANRLTAVAFDQDGDGTVEETVSYAYDIAGRRTQLTFDGQTIDYSYDDRGRLISMTDWDTHTTTFTYDNAGRLQRTEDTSGLKRIHTYDAAGRLRKIEYRDTADLVGLFEYDVDARGNRTQATEQLISAEVPLVADDLTTVSGSWVQNGDFFETMEMFAEIQFEVAGNRIELVMGEGPDHGIYDVYVNNILWGSPDGYNAMAGERTLVLTMTTAKTHTVRIRGRADKNQQSTGRKIGFKLGEGNFVERVIQYDYDALSRLLSADIFSTEQATTPIEEHIYTYDLAGNRLSATVLENSVQTSQQTHTFDAANRISSFSYDDAGRLLSDGTTTHTWDRAERLLSTADTVNTHTYAYNGLGQRLSQDVNGTLTTYLLDVQPGLYNVLASSTGPDTTRFVKHGNRILRQQQPSGQWQHLLTDGLGSVRSVLDANHLPLETIHYSPYGEGSPTASLHGFTGEPTDTNGLVHLRARYYDPALGVFPSLDPVEGNPSQPLSLARYAYVQGNPVNMIDATGLSPSCSGNMPPECPSGSFPRWQSTWQCCSRYNRGQAVQYAIQWSSENPANSNQYAYYNAPRANGGRDTNCANFVSQALVAGNWLMTYSGWQVNSPTRGSSTEWACFNNSQGQCEGTNAWKVADLMANVFSRYATDSVKKDRSNNSSGDNFGEVYDFGESNAYHNIVVDRPNGTQSFRISNAIDTMAEEVRNSGIGIGDIFYLPDSNPPHIALIVGWGPKLSSWQEAENPPSIKLTPSHGDVPYIVDNGRTGTWPITNTVDPIPFYLLRMVYQNGAIVRYGGSQWHFYKIPDQVCANSEDIVPFGTRLSE